MLFQDSDKLKHVGHESRKMRKNKNQSDHDVDALFRLPLTEFTSARNGLAAQLKKKGRTQDASDVKALGKPSVSAWAVNQMYWNHRDVYRSPGGRSRVAHSAGLSVSALTVEITTAAEIVTANCR